MNEYEEWDTAKNKHQTRTPGIAPNAPGNPLLSAYCVQKKARVVVVNERVCECAYGIFGSFLYVCVCARSRVNGIA